MEPSQSDYTELIVAGFDDAYTASLALAALARLQEDLELAMNEIAVVIREKGGSIALQQTLTREADDRESSILWGPLADQLFAHESPTLSASAANSRAGTTVDIDPAVASHISVQLRLCKSALLVRSRVLSQREKLSGVLQGFGGKILRASLSR